MTMLLCWEAAAWEDYLYWQQCDKQTFRRVNDLIKDALRQPFTGLGKPEPLKGNLSGYWSRRITTEHRLVYWVSSDMIIIAQCRYHY